MKVYARTSILLIVMLWATAAFIPEPALVWSAGQSDQSSPVSPSPVARIENKNFTFDPVVDGTIVTHEFFITNKGPETLRINKVKTG